MSRMFFKDKTEKFIEEQCEEEMEANVIIKLRKEVREFQYEEIPDIHEWFKYIPKKVYPNIIEWINGDDISYISYEGLSIKELIDAMDLPREIKEKYYSVFMKRALELFTEYIKDIETNNSNLVALKHNYLYIASIAYHLP